MSVIPHYLAAERLKIPIAIIAGLSFGVGLAVAVGSGSFSTLRRVFIVGAFLSVMLFGQHHAWRIALAICLLDFFYLGLGFSMWNIEQTGFLAVLIILVTWWRKEKIKRPAVMETLTFGIFNIALLLWLTYAFSHLVYNTLDPYNPTEFALKNFLKTTVQFSGPLLLLFYFMHRPQGIVVNKRVLVHIVAIGLFALAINLFTRFWELGHGMLEPVNQIEGETPYFSIPSLDIMANYYALRNLGPTLAVISIVLINGTWFVRQSFLVRAGVWSLYLLSVVGAIFSGGRATLVFIFVLSLAALWLRHYYRLVLVLADVLRPLPAIAQRSLQTIVFTTESVEARSSIDSSTTWRKELIQRAFELWRVDSRVFWFGRGTYKFGSEDFRALKANAGVGAMEVSLRRGATHSLVTDLLLVFGVTGFVIYMTMFTSLLLLLWRLWKSPESDEISKALTLMCFLLASFNLIYGIVGGGIFPLALAWILVILFAYLYRAEAAGTDQGPPKLGSFRGRTGRAPVFVTRHPRPVPVRRFAGR
jgi:hypothetical protein